MRSPELTRPRRRAIARGLLALTAVTTVSLVAGCSSGGGDAAPTDDAELTTVSFALSYLPDPSLNGIAYAIEQGWFADKGIEVEFVPFSGSPAETLVSTGSADFGLGSDLRSTLLSAAAGADVVSTFATYQTAPYSLAVLEESPYASPKDLAGKSFGTFGSPYEVAIADDMIAADGGSGGVESVMLSTDIYSALAAGRIDASLAFPGDSWIIEEGGNAIRSWSTTDYGLPDTYGGLLLTSQAYMDENPEIVADFTEVMQAGYEATLEDREAADAALLALFPDDLSPEIVDYVSKIQNEKFIPSASGVVGDQTAEVWQENADWLISHDLLTDPNGDTLTEYDPSALFTTDYLN